MNVAGEFESLDLWLSRQETLCVPTQKLPQPAPVEMDAYKCYKATLAKQDTKLHPREAMLSDSLHGGMASISRPVSVCAPVSIDGSAVRDPSVWLGCYVANDAAGGRQKFEPMAQVISNSIAPSETLLLRKPRQYCAPISGGAEQGD
jgi:hypothetical protein